MEVAFAEGGVLGVPAEVADFEVGYAFAGVAAFAGCGCFRVWRVGAVEGFAGPLVEVAELDGFVVGDVEDLLFEVGLGS